VYACNADSPNEVYYNSNDSLQTASVNETKIVAMPSQFNIGRKATAAEIHAWDIDIRPDGKGLPTGEGDAQAGKIIYEMKCISCHGKNGAGAAYSRLVGVDDTIKAKTIGNYWPYASTVFDYIRRTMPYTSPGTLTNEEVYGLTAYLLSQNKIIDSTTRMNEKTLPKVVMPAQKYFVNDDRRGGPEVR
jgi:cytochrome c